MIQRWLVDESQRQQVSRIIEHCVASNRAVLSLVLSNVQTEFVRAGRAGSGAEMNTYVERISQAGGFLINELVNKIAAVSRTPDAFDELECAVRRWLRGCADEFINLNRLSRSVRLQGKSAALEIGKRGLIRVGDDLEKRLAIERYDFEQSRVSKAAAQVSLHWKKGGRPPAEFWDDMWAAIATALYSGKLNPKSQADVQRAMSEWIDGRGYSAADSTVKGRARRLWDLIEALDE